MNYERLAAIHGASFTLGPRPWTADEIASVLASSNTRLFETDGGFAIFRQAGPEAELLTIAVHPDYRRQGIAANLMKIGLIPLKESGVEEVFLEVSVENIGAIALYLSKGYVKRATRKNYYSGPNGKKISALVMVLKL